MNGEDLLPDLAIGRLPAASGLELRAMISKILAYEAGVAGLDGLVVLATDNSDARLGQERGVGRVPHQRVGAGNLK